MRTHKAAWTAFRRGMTRISERVPRLLTFVFLHNVIKGLTPFLTAWMFSRIIDGLCNDRSPHDVWLWTIFTVVTDALLIMLSGALKRIKEAKWECLYREVESMTSDKLLSLDHAAFSDKHTRELYKRTKEHTSALGMGLVKIPDIFQHLVKGAVGLLSAIIAVWGMFTSPLPPDSDFAFLNSPLTAAVTVLTLTAVIVLSSHLSSVSGRITDAATDSVVALDRAYYALYNMMFDQKRTADIRLYRQDRLITEHLGHTDAAFFAKGGLKRQPFRDVLLALADALPILWLGMMYLLIIIKAQGGAFPIAFALLYLTAVTLLVRYVSQLGEGLKSLSRNTPYLETALQFFDIPHQMYRGSLTTEKRTDCDYELTFRNVSFTYPAGKAPALTHVNITLIPGKRVAVVGENGSGKSTFVKLIARLYDPEEGEILLNGIDIRKYRHDDYIDLISVVFQDHQLLKGTLGGNVAGGDHFDRDRVLRCLDEVGFTLPVGDDPLREELFRNGTSPSAGDTQKIAIARALYKHAPIIILDQPTATLDPVTEAEIYTHLDRIVGDRTAVFISHRLSSCRFCDEILVFDGGRIVQRGTHAELLAQKDGKYCALWNAQAQYYQ